MKLNPNYKNVLESQAHGISADTWMISHQIFTNIPQFETWSGAGKPIHHHYGDGGLARHTKEVIDLMFSSDDTLHLNLRPDLIFLAGLFHDIGKVWDYEKADRNLIYYDEGIKSGDWVKTKHARNIHHISRSALVWSQAVNHTGHFQKEHDEILHAILAHHGQREWGSPVMPNTKLAWLLHLCDGISARMDDCEKHDFVRH